MPGLRHAIPTLADKFDSTFDEVAHTPSNKAIKRVLHLLERRGVPTTALALQASCEFPLERVLSVLAILEAKGLAVLNARGTAVLAFNTPPEPAPQSAVAEG